MTTKISTDFDVIIIGAGSAGLSARKVIAKHTNRYCVVDRGPLGTTCARVGCMPSKAFIEAAHIFGQRSKLTQIGVSGHENLTVDTCLFMEHVRKLRDRFVRSVLADMKEWEHEHFLQGTAKVIGPRQVIINEKTYEAQAIIVATGSTPVVPDYWEGDFPHLCTTDNFFELRSLQGDIAVVGLGVIGLELGLAMTDLGLNVTAFGRQQRFGGIDDPDIRSYAFKKLSQKLPVVENRVKTVLKDKNRLKLVLDNDEEYLFDHILAAIGRKPNLDVFDFNQLTVKTDTKGLPVIDDRSFKIPETNIYLVGDSNMQAPILHEAADQGYIAATHVTTGEFLNRRVPLAILFSHPQIARVGQKRSTLDAQQIPYIVGSVTYEGQGRAITKLEEQGLVHIYSCAQTGTILGAEFFAPGAEHMAHLIAALIHNDCTIRDALNIPFYHPVLEEGLRTALRDSARQLATSQTP